MVDRRGRYAESLRNDQTLLAGARRAVARRGSAVSVADIAAESGLGVGSIYRRFTSKEALLQYLCTLALEQVAAAAEAALLAPPGWAAFADFVAAAVDDAPGSLAAVAEVIEVTGEMWASAARVRDLLGAVVDRAHGCGALRPDVTALDLQSLLVQLGRPSAGPTDAAEDNIRRRLVALALDGLRGPAGNPGASPLPGYPPRGEQFDDVWRRDRRHAATDG